jgi:LysM repeat protein
MKILEGTVLFQHRLIFLALAAMFLVTTGCGTGTKQSPVASDSLQAGEEVGELTEEFNQEDDEQAAQESDENMEISDDLEDSDEDGETVAEKTYTDTYTVRPGDSLSSIAGKEEIYGDSLLWPILQENNSDILGSSQSVNVGSVLTIPRRLTSEEMDEAREKARQHSAAERSKKAAPSPVVEKDTQAGAGKVAKEPAPVVEEDLAAAPVEPKPRVEKPKEKGIMPILIVVFVVLLAAALILLYFMKKDNDDEEA